MTENFFTVKFRITPNLEKYLPKHGIKVQSAELYDEDIVKIGNELNRKVFTISVEEKESIKPEEHDDKSAVFTTIWTKH